MTDRFAPSAWYSVDQQLFYHLASYWHLCSLNGEMRRHMTCDDPNREIIDRLTMHLVRHKAMLDELCDLCGVTKTDVGVMMQEVYDDFREDMAARESMTGVQ